LGHKPNNLPLGPNSPTLEQTCHQEETLEGSAPQG